MSVAQKPAGYVLWGVWYEAKAWNLILHGVATQVHFHRQATFDETIEAPEFRGPRRRYISDSPEQMDAPLQIGDSQYWIETKFNRVETIMLARRLLRFFGYHDADLRVMTEINPADDPTQTPSA